jgi:hypothetical protein
MLSLSFVMSKTAPGCDPFFLRRQHIKQLLMCTYVTAGVNQGQQLFIADQASQVL